jgi:hypothetical protein
MLLKDIGERAIQILDELSLSHLPGRPFDNHFGLFDPSKNKPTLIVMGLNGSRADKGKTNRQAVQDGLYRPEYSNLKNGLDQGWGGSKTLPRRLQQVVNTLGFEIDQTIFTNTILICSENAGTIGEEAQTHGMDIRSIIEKSMAFHKRFTFEVANPKAIFLYSNSLYNFSAANVWRQTMQTSEVLFLRSGAYWFHSLVNGIPVPTLCVPHMSRVPPDGNALLDFCEIIAPQR